MVRARRSTIIPSREVTDARLALSGWARAASNQVDSTSWRSVRSIARCSSPRVGKRLEAEGLGRPGVADDDLVAEALDERPGDPGGDRRDEADPVGGKPGRQDRDRDHEAAQAAQAGIGPHHVAVGEDVRAADLDDPAHLRAVERAGEVVEDVADADRLAAGAHPARRDHHRQALSEVAEDLERGAAGADDHRRPELRDGDAVGRQLGAGLVAAGQVVREIGLVVAQAAEVNDPRDAGPPCLAGEVAGGPAIPLGEPVLAGTHRVGQVVGDLDPLERRGQGGRVQQVGGDDAVVGEARRQRSRVAAHEDQVVAARPQQGDEAPADVAAGADDEDLHAGIMRGGSVSPAHDPRGSPARNTRADRRHGTPARIAGGARSRRDPVRPLVRTGDGEGNRPQPARRRSERT
jgi:hypothetical protein